MPNRTGVVPDQAALAAAFRDLHGRRLHGFAMLLTLDPDRAALLAAEALAAGAARADALRHPERGAAWLRARVVGAARRAGRPAPRASRTLELLGVDHATAAALASLDVASRAAVIATITEGFDPRDVATIVGVEGRRLARLVERGTERFLAARAMALGLVPPEGPTIDRLHAAARRAIT